MTQDVPECVWQFADWLNAYACEHDLESPADFAPHRERVGEKAREFGLRLNADGTFTVAPH